MKTFDVVGGEKTGGIEMAFFYDCLRPEIIAEC